MGNRNSLGQLDLFDVELQATCRECGIPLTPRTYQGNKKVWCSKACRAQNYRRRPGVAERHAVLAAERHRDTYVPIRYEKTCEICGVEFVTKQRPAICCSRKCAAVRSFRLQQADGYRDRPEIAAKRAEWMKANRYRYREKQRLAQAARYRTDGGRTRDRSRENARRRSVALNGPAKRRWALKVIDRAARGTTGGGTVYVAGPCRWCGDPFVGRGSASAYCSVSCTRAYRKSPNRMGKNLTKPQRLKVFERDGWTCRICGDPVNRQAVVPALDAPVIDHRVPLAAGGTHEESNWQTAHFYCNSVKRDQVDFDFAA